MGNVSLFDDVFDDFVVTSKLIDQMLPSAKEKKNEKEKPIDTSSLMR